jgi:hypothetical protein
MTLCMPKYGQCYVNTYMNNNTTGHMQSERTDLGQFRFKEVKLKYPYVKSW